MFRPASLLRFFAPFPAACCCGLFLAGAFLCPSDNWRFFLGASFAVSFAWLWETKRLTPALALLIGFTVYAAAFYWVPQVIMAFASWSPLLAFPAGFLFWMLEAGQIALVPFLGRAIEKHIPSGSLIAMPLAWLTTEMWYPRIAPWQLGQVTIGQPWLAQAASLSGASLLSFLLLWWAGPIARLLCRKRLPLPLLGAQLLSLLLVGGYWELRRGQLEADLHAAPTVRTAMIQANLDPRTDFTLERWAANIEKHRRLSRQALAQTPLDLLVWPESAVGTDFGAGERLVPRESSRHPFPETTVPLLFGGQTLVSARTLPASYYLSAHLMTPDGSFAGRYDKRRFIPFAEKIPLEDHFSFLNGLHKRNYALVRGEEEQSMLLPLKGANGAKKYYLGIAICFEEIWPDAYLVSDPAASPNLLLSLSNDAWFLDSAAAAQHHLLARWRAIEVSRYLLRSTNSGQTSIVDYSGKIVDIMPSKQEGILAGSEVKLLSNTTVFAYGGESPLVLLTLPFVLLFVCELYAKIAAPWRMKQIA